jgi:phenylacetate-CoA ligase
MWDTKVYQGYGLTEMGTSIAGECIMQNGMHITETDFYAEIVDPKTGEILEDGEIGELVFSTLSREGMPLLRYRTHDLGLIIPEKCRCGLPFKRIKIKGRTDKMVTIGSGDNIYPTAFDNVIHNITGVIDYQIELIRKNNKDHLTVYIESKSPDEKLKQTVNEALMSLPEIRNGIYESKTIEQPEIKILKPHTIDRKGVKAKKIIDNRNLYE